MWIVYHSSQDFMSKYEKSNLSLVPRDSFFGGITQPTKLFKKVNHLINERIIMFTSLLYIQQLIFVKKEVSLKILKMISNNGSIRQGIQ